MPDRGCCRRGAAHSGCPCLFSFSCVGYPANPRLLSHPKSQGTSLFCDHSPCTPGQGSEISRELNLALALPLGFSFLLTLVYITSPNKFPNVLGTHPMFLPLGIFAPVTVTERQGQHCQLLLITPFFSYRGSRLRKYFLCFSWLEWGGAWVRARKASRNSLRVSHISPCGPHSWSSKGDGNSPA